MVEAELSTLFTDAQVVGMQGWDGAYLLTTKDADKIGLAISRFCAKHPDARPRYDVTLADADLARLLWLDWWTRHTLTTCNLPTFYIR